MAFKKDTLRKDGAIVARQVQGQVMDFEKVLKWLDLNTSLSVTDIRSVFLLFTEHLTLFLPDGNQIETPFGTFSLRVKVSAKSLSDGQIKAPATGIAVPDKLSVRLRTSRSLVNRLKTATTVEIVETPDLQRPEIFYVRNTGYENTFSVGAPGEVLHISGKRLSFLTKDLDQGVFFIALSGAEEVRVPTYAYPYVGSSIVLCKVPDLPPGGYRLEVRTNPNRTTIRAGALKAPFTV